MQLQGRAASPGLSMFGGRPVIEEDVEEEEEELGIAETYSDYMPPKSKQICHSVWRAWVYLISRDEKYTCILEPYSALRYL